MADAITVPRRFVAVGVLAVLLTGWALLLTYLYERGYAGALGVDKSYIDITTSSIAATGLRFIKLLTIAVIAVQMVNFGLSRVEFKSQAIMYLYTLFEALLLGALLYWAAWDYSLSALGKALVLTTLSIRLGLLKCSSSNAST